MRKIAIFFIICGLIIGGGGGEARAVTTKGKTTPTTMATATVTVVPTALPEAVKENITEPKSLESSFRLESVLDEQVVGNWNGINTMRKIVRAAVARGVSANTIVLVLLLPLIATLVGVLHYILGLTGYGIFLPTMIAVSFLATGIAGGLVLFGMILAISLVTGIGLKRFKLHFWPARSINLLFISLGALGLMVASSFFKIVDLTKVSIFPVLLMIMLAEDFVRTSLVKSKDEARKLMIGTLVLGVAGAMVMSVDEIQKMVLLYPEVVIVLVLLVNWAVGNYSGIRLTEIERFKKAIREKK